MFNEAWEGPALICGLGGSSHLPYLEAERDVPFRVAAWDSGDCVSGACAVNMRDAQSIDLASLISP